MKIYQLIFTLSSSGAERVVVNLSNELSKVHEVSIICIQKLNETNSFYKDLISPNVNIIDLENNKGINFKAFYQIFSLIKREKPNVVHAHLNTIIYCFLPSLFLAKKIKFFHTLHSIAEKVIGFKFQKKINKIFYKKYIVPIAISKLCAESYRQLYKLNGIKAIENGVPSACLSNKFELVRKEVLSYKKNDGTITFISIGRIVKEKNQLMLVKTFNNIIKKGYNVNLIIIGNIYSKEIFKNLEGYIIDGINFLGEKNNPIDYLKASDAFVLSSHWEGLPMTVLEALSCGLPILSTPVGGLPDVVNREDFGVLSKSTNSSDFEEALIKFINHYEFFDKNAISDYFKNNFNIQKSSKLHYELYK